MLSNEMLDSELRKEIIKQLETIKDTWILNQILKFIVNMRG